MELSELSSNLLLFLLTWTIFSHQYRHVDGLRCYACFYDEVTGLGHTCERPNNRECYVDCKSREDVDKALEYIGITYKAQRQAVGLERRSGDAQEPEESQFVCVLVRGNFQEFKLGTGILRSCWQVPKGQVVECRELKLRDGDEATFDGCYCAKNHKDGLPCNEEHNVSLIEEDREDELGIQPRYKGSHERDNDNDQDDDEDHDDDDDVHHAAKSHGNPSNMLDHILNAFIIVIMVISVDFILVASAILTSVRRIPANV